MAPAEETSQEVVSIASVSALPPIATAPVVVPVPMLTAKLDEAFRLIVAPVTVAPRFPVRSWVTVKAPLLVVVTPALPIETEVAFVVPRLRAVAESTVSAPAEVDQVAAAAEVRVSAPVEVDQVEAAPPVRVRAPEEVKEDAPVGVRLTEPAPLAVKFPEVRVKAMLVELAVVIVAPPL